MGLDAPGLIVNLQAKAGASVVGLEENLER